MNIFTESCATCVYYVKNKCYERVGHGVILPAIYGGSMCAYRRATDAETATIKASETQNAEAN